MEQQKVENALNYDGGKPRWDLLPYDALEEVVKVYTMGAEKYAPRNWEAGMSYSRSFGSLMRHITAFWNGEDLDQESGYHHLGHAVFRCLQLIAFTQRGVGTDDRPIGDRKPSDTVEWEELSDRTAADQELINAMHNNLPALLEVVEALEMVVDQLESPEREVAINALAKLEAPDA